MSTNPLSHLPAASQFPPTSRYHGIEIAVRAGADGKPQAYLRRRFVPPPEDFATLQEHVVKEGERIDHVAARHLGDSEQFWRICDANGAMQPTDLTDPSGQTVRITLPQGIPAPSANA